MKRNVLRIVFAASIVLILTVVSGLIFASYSSVKDSEAMAGFPQSFAQLAKQVKPAVVNISTTSTVTIPENPFKQFFGQHDDLFGNFYGQFFNNMPDRKMKRHSLGSGFIIDKEGYIITNNHVVDSADKIIVKLSDGRECLAKLIGRDDKTDLALIKVSSFLTDMPTLTLGNSDNMQVGDWVLATGNPFGLEHTVTQGIISASGRVIGSGPYDNFLQTDAPINPGNSGGPLVNMKGEVIGINTAIVSSGQGIGFAIPSNTAKAVIAQLRDKGKVVRGWIGVSIQSVTPDLASAFGLKEPTGALVADVVSGGPAEKGGIKQGDIITFFDEKAVKSSSDIPWIVAETPVGKTVEVKVLRQGKEVDFKIKVEEMKGQGADLQTENSKNDYGLAVDNIKPEWKNRFNITASSGVVVTDIVSGSLSEDAGIQPGDVIREVNKEPVKNLSDYQKEMEKSGRGKAVLFLINRGDQVFYVSIKVS
ncbi:MAG: DegQ family serine endoprotease [Smithella sp.]